MLCLGIFVGTETYNHSSLLKVLIVCAGVGFAAYGDMHANWFGVCLQFGSVLCDCTRCILMQIVMQANQEVKLSPVDTLFFVAPMAATVLFVPSLVIEMPVLIRLKSIPWLWLVASCMSTASLNLVVFTLVGKTSALTTSMVGPFKEAFCLFIGKEIYDTPVTVQQWFGYSVALFGTTWYNYDNFMKRAGNFEPQLVENKPLLPPSTSDVIGAANTSGAALDHGLLSRNC